MASILSRPGQRRVLGFALRILLVLAGEVLNGIAFRALIMPARLLSGGVVGTSLLLNQILGWPVGLQTTLYNIPIFLMGWRFLGRRFALLSVVGVGSFSLLLDNLNLPPISINPLLVAVFGGVLTGLADGLILRSGGSTGGFDIIGLIVSRRFGVSIGQVFLVFNGIIISIAAIYNNLELALYTLIMLFVSSRMINTSLAPTPRPLALVISTRHREIADRLLHELRRGVTYLQAEGAYTATEMRVLLCVITRYELLDLKRIVAEVDPAAFTVMLEASDVIGRFDRPGPLQRFLG